MEAILEEHERRITKLEEHRESDLLKISENYTNWATMTVEMKNLTKSIETLTQSIKKNIDENNKARIEQYENLNAKFDRFEERVQELDTKIVQNRTEIEQELMEKTVGKDSEKWNKVVWLIISGGISAIVAFIIGRILP